MAQIDKLLQRLVTESDAAFSFDEIVRILRALGFSERIHGGHHIFRRSGLREIVNLQPRSDGSAKYYQVRQVRRLVVNYHLWRFDDDEV
ncbi:MAG: toxin HicA [Anaerolinea sp.]|nr:toxin HicA [Anaerolinea sp.]